ncbi:MAG: cadmium-translocating P-type ATPase [Firmicutes bacterium]|nr:cadmium-translocating P-type ATPase [Bacillota bacterium]
MQVLAKYKLNGLHCSGCAEKIQDTLNETEGLENSVLNFGAGMLTINPQYLCEAQEIIDTIEPGVTLVEVNNQKPNQYEANFNLKKQIAVMASAFVLLLIGIVFNNPLHDTPYNVAEYAVLLPAYLLVGWPVLTSALKNIFKGNVFDENFLMTVATLGAIAIHQLPEAVGVMLFFYIGETFQEMAVNRSRRSIKDLMDIRPEYAHLMINDKLSKVSPETVNIGDIIVVKPGEKVPLDGIVLEGNSMLDTSALTGESVPRKVENGKEVLAGMINTTGLIRVEVKKDFADSSVAKILDLVENAGNRKAATEKFITKFSRYYTPAVVFGALALALIPPIFIPGATFSEWVYRALILLVISCPCALVVSIPLGYFGGIGSASKKGILIKGANFLEALTNLDTVVFDKTGTLTKGVFKVTDVVSYNGFTKDGVLRYASIAEANSNHPIAKSIIAAYDGDIKGEQLEQYQEISGHGIMAKYNGKEILAGNERLLNKENIKTDNISEEGTVVYVAVDGVVAGYITIADEIKEDSAVAIQKLKQLGVNKTVMLTGDDKSVAEKVASKLGLDVVFAKLLPEDKVSKLESLINDSAKGKLAFVGDGINDAPVLTRADVGIAMGGLGSDAAIEAADVVIMDDMPSKVSTAVGIARHTRKIIIQNIVMALGVKGVVVVLGAMGMANMWAAVFADVGVALMAIANATRVLKYHQE